MPPLLPPQLAALVPGPLRDLDAEIADRLKKAALRLGSFGYDPYGFSPAFARRFLLPAAALYRWYFRVETFGIERVPEGRVLLIGNHAGQFAYDGAMLAVAMLLEGRAAARPPRDGRALPVPRCPGSARPPRASA